MRISQQTLRSVITHAVAWVCFAAYEQSVFLIVGNAQPNLLYLFLQYVINAALFYLHSQWLLPMCDRHRYILYGLLTIGALAVYVSIRGQMYMQLTTGLHDPAMPVIASYSHFAVLSVYRGTFFIFTSAGYWLARKAVAAERLKREHEQKLSTAERRLIEDNLAFLKNQINPHFLFNALNFLYAQIYPHSETAAQGILLLADMMRYALRENTNGKAMLTQEVQHLHNYIALQQLRFNHQLKIVFEVVGNTQFLMIPPLVLLTFVENCFKHGELSDAVDPLTIRLEVNQNCLCFTTRNKKRYGPKEESTGIGLANTTQRLAAIYQERYELIVVDGPHHYTCTLRLTL
jgi:LytS/YehU family sensor histidine kinase